MSTVLYACTGRQPSNISQTPSANTYTTAHAYTVLHNQTIQNNTSYGTFVATLKTGIDNVPATTNDSSIFIATKGQLFLYENYSHNAWIADGRSGYIPPDKVVKVDTAYFKFNYSKFDFGDNPQDEMMLLAKENSVDLLNLIKRIKKKDGNALFRLYELHRNIDGGAAETYPYIFWALVNHWTDKELSAFINTLKQTDKYEFCNLLLTSTILDNPEKYYEMYYPLTKKVMLNVQQDVECYAVKDFLIIYTTKDYASALSTAQKASKSLNIKLDLRNLKPDKDTLQGLTLPADTCLAISRRYDSEDSSCYYARGKFDDGIYISIEYSNQYLGFSRGYYIVMAGSSGDKSTNNLDATLKKIKAKYPDAYIKKSKVYMCCSS